VKLSLRSRDDAVDCNRTAALFGGGGHRAAAGATIPGPLADVRRRVIESLRPQLANEHAPAPPNPT
jgi:phosphoesterase RecJ-like protein